LKIQKFLLITLIIFLIFNVSVFAQSSGEFSVERKITGNADKFGEKNSINYQIFENENEKYSIHIEKIYDAPIPALKVFEDGSSVLINTFDATLTFYNSTGTELLKVKIRKDFHVVYERTVHSYISGKYLAISLSQPDKAYSIIQIYNNQGSLVYSWDINENKINGLIYSYKDSKLAVSLIKWPHNKLLKSTIFYQSDGSEISQAAINFTKGFFINKSNVFVGYTNDNYFLFDYSKKELVLDESPNADEMILLVEYIDNEVFVVSAEKPILNHGKWFYKKPTIFRYDLTGNSKSQYKFDSNLFSEFILLGSGESLTFKTEEQIFHVK